MKPLFKNTILSNIHQHANMSLWGHSLQENPGDVELKIRRSLLMLNSLFVTAFHSPDTDNWKMQYNSIGDCKYQFKLDILHIQQQKEDESFQPFEVGYISPFLSLSSELSWHHYR